MARMNGDWATIESPSERAIVIATTLHRGQFRKHPLNLPYIVHPMAVLAQIVRWQVHDEDCWSAAALHDVLEDCDLTRLEEAELRQLIGETAFGVVEELTFRGQSRQKEDYLASFAEKSVAALVVKIADRLCNTRDFLDSGDAPYAAKYWQKAKRLREAVVLRAAEIETRYRGSRADWIVRDCEKLTTELRT